MYSDKDTAQLIEQTKTVLLQLSNNNLEKHLPTNKTTAHVLQSILQFHEYRYYVLNDPIIADIEYDTIFKYLEKIESLDPTLQTTNSPTQRVAKGLSKAFATVQHIVPMLSLQNSYNADDLLDWDRKAKDLTELAAIAYSVEPKFDGASISLIYENDLLVRGTTRGNGVEGDDITNNIKQIRSIPLSAKFSTYGIAQIEIRGEVLMNKSNFIKYNKQLAEQNIPPLANPRNAAAGALRMKDPAEVGKRNLEAFLYHVSFYQLKPNTAPHLLLQTHSGMLQMLWECGFRSPVKEMKVFEYIDNVIEYCTHFEQLRDDLAYEVDGMVVKVNDTVLQDQLGMTTHHPRWAIAYKFKARQATSQLRAVEFQVGRTGSITPVAKIDPVFISGVTVSSISLFNEEVIREKDLKIGDTVLVERAGDVIPYIVKSIAEARKGTEDNIIFPTICPVCSAALHKPEEESVWRCINPNCAAQIVERIIHFASKGAMDIKGFGEANVRKLYDLQLLKDIPGIYTLDFEKMSELEGFGKRSIENLKAAIEQSKQQPLHRLIFALGIRYVGENTAKILSRTATHLLDLQSFSVEQLQALEDVGPKAANSVYDFFHTPVIIDMLNRLEQLGVSLHNHTKTILTSELVNQAFLFTGTLTTMKRSEAEALVEAKGGIILNTVSSKLNYLVVGEDAGSKLEKAKKINTIKILSEEEWKELIDNESLT